MSPAELKELLNVLAATPALIQGLLENVSDEQLRLRSPEGEFSLVENVCHLRDIEAEGYAPRIKRILNEDRPVLADIDGGRLAVEREYNQQNAQAALEAFAEARSASARLLAGLESDHLSRAGTFEGVGEVQLQDLLVMMREHDADHLKQMSEVKRQMTTGD